MPSLPYGHRRPIELWNRDNIPRSINEYLYSFRGEFSDEAVESDYPYNGVSTTFFRQLLKIQPNNHFHRFQGIANGIGCWTLRTNHILNNLTADLLAAAELLGGTFKTHSSSSSPGGIGADSSDIWVSLLDGGIGVEVLAWEHETTNRVHASQATTIRGSKAYRALLELLGLKWINRKLPGEDVIPSHKEYIKLVDDQGDEDDDNFLILSPLQRSFYSAEKTVRVAIYRNGQDDEEWMLEVVDEFNNSILYPNEFLTDQLALEQFLEDVVTDGIDAFFGKGDPASREANIALMRVGN